LRVPDDAVSDHEAPEDVAEDAGAPFGASTIERRRWLERRALQVGTRRSTNRAAVRPSDASISDARPYGWPRRHWTSRVLHRLGDRATSPRAGILAAGLVLGWAVVGVLAGFPGWWQTTLYSVTASVTFVMVFVIQHTQERQIAASQRKLDELIRSSETADDTLIAVEGAADAHLQALGDLNAADRRDVLARPPAAVDEMRDGTNP
jgi:low affinity Fe/Cu permease